MNKKTLTYLLILVLTGVVAYFLNKNANTQEVQLSDFAVKDTSSIDKIFIADSYGQTIKLSKTDGVWYVNGKTKANVPAVNLILKTFHNVEMRNPVPETMKENLIKDMITRHIKVDIYQNGENTKSWILGPDTEDKYATYILLEEHGVRSSDAYAVHIPGFRGFLTARFFTTENEWKTQHIFRVHPNELDQVSYIDYDNPSESHTVKYVDDNNIKLYDGNGNEVSQFDTLRVKDYILSFKSVNHNKYPPLMKKAKVDSIQNHAKFSTIILTTKSGQTDSIEMFYKDLTPPVVNINGDTTFHDLDHFYGLTDSNFVKLQYYHMDRVLKPLSYLIK